MCGCSGSQDGAQAGSQGTTPNQGMGDIYWNGPKATTPAPEKTVSKKK